MFGDVLCDLFAIHITQKEGEKCEITCSGHMVPERRQNSDSQVGVF